MAKRPAAVPPTEAELIDLAIDPDHRERYHLLLSNPKKRRRLLDKLNHNVPLHPRRTTWYRTFTAALKDAGRHGDVPVYLLSDTSSLDKKIVTFQEAAVEVPRGGWGTLIGVSTTLAIYYGECGERAAVIRA